MTCMPDAALVGWRLRLYLQMSMGCAEHSGRDATDRVWDQAVSLRVWAFGGSATGTVNLG